MEFGDEDEDGEDEEDRYPDIEDVVRDRMAQRGMQQGHYSWG